MWPKPSCRAQWKGEEDKADRGRGGKTKSLEFAKSQRAVEKREKWRKLVAKSSVVPQWPWRLRERWDDDGEIFRKYSLSMDIFWVCRSWQMSPQIWIHTLGDYITLHCKRTRRQVSADTTHFKDHFSWIIRVVTLVSVSTASDKESSCCFRSPELCFVCFLVTRWTQTSLWLLHQAGQWGGNCSLRPWSTSIKQWDRIYSCCRNRQILTYLSDSVLCLRIIVHAGVLSPCPMVTSESACPTTEPDSGFGLLPGCLINTN